MFDGISIGRLALSQLDIPVERYLAYEINDKPIKCSKSNWSDIEHRGDVHNIDYEEILDFDLLIGGSPCSDLSTAMAQRKGLRGSKSSLFYNYYDTWIKMGKPLFLFENVGGMPKKDEKIISELFGSEPIKINSKKYAPAMRNRLYWTNITEDTFNVNKTLFSNNNYCNLLSSVLSEGFTDRTHARALLASDSRPLTASVKMLHRYWNKGFTTLVFKDKVHYESCKKIFDIHIKGLSAKEVDYLLDSNIDFGQSVFTGVRYLNQEELERCQTVPIGYTKMLNRNQAAHVLGMGWTTEVIKRLLAGKKF